MTKTLTEQWREGTLPEGWYYTIITGFTDKEKMMIDYFIPELNHFEIKPTRCIKEVVATVPSYDEYKRLQEQLDIVTEQRDDIHIDKQVLQEQLNEANEVIKTTNRVSGNIDLSQLVYEDRRKVDGITMQTGSYLEKWGAK